ncbi:hypothetical protein AU106_gp071 [Sinorhizobium phage phiM9]|uniref:Uncharacterized protein n=1 Tax=Sinorhizobium phage phiM9 TaxID=1636182 RepID=A0A0F6R4X2_9CAUD|nr:hypothetical protein AU106_gp071 [Sinorhizobium phage phiM9]AKE44702.1 hypothetical protein Sm_phiM9_072 [Sinorhizobium phage phiM9]
MSPFLTGPRKFEFKLSFPATMIEALLNCSFDFDVRQLDDRYTCVTVHVKTRQRLSELCECIRELDKTFDMDRLIDSHEVK